jgi:thioredoxin reductase (NADPH)
VSKRIDCLVIGGGPAGLTAAIYLGRFRRTVTVVDNGFSRASLIPTTHNYPGFAGGISGPELLAYCRDQAIRYGAEIRADAVTKLEAAAGGLTAVLSDRSIAASKVVLATGIVDGKPALPSLHEFIYRGGVRFCPICDGYEAQHRRIGLVGPTREIVKKALFLRTYSSDLVLLPLDDPSSASLGRLCDAGIVLPREPVVDLLTDGDAIRAIMRSGATLEVEILYPAMGATVRSQLATALGATANENGCLVVDQRQRTSVADLYAVGDVTLELHQLSVAIGQSAVAATDIHNSLPPNYC